MTAQRTVDVTTPSDEEVRVTRAFAASRARVFDAFTRPELITRWMLGPPGWTMPVCEIDLRVGGRYLYTWRHPEQGEFSMTGEFRELLPPARIVHTEHYVEGGPDARSVVATLFTEQDGMTTVAMTIRFADKVARDAALATGMTDGMALGYVRLDEMLTS